MFSVHIIIIAIKVCNLNKQLKYLAQSTTTERLLILLYDSFFFSNDVKIQFMNDIVYLIIKRRRKKIASAFVIVAR
jgi:hypothetical protein